VNITLQLEREHSFQNQIRRNFVLRKGASLTGDLRLFASTWPFGVLAHDVEGRLGVEFSFSYESKLWLYRGFIGAQRLWPTSGSRVLTSTELHYPIGPLVGLRDDRAEYHYLLPDGSERRFALKYVGFECWVDSCQEPVLHLKLKHFLPGADHVVICYSLSIEDVLFRKEDKLSYDAEGFLEDIPGVHPFVRIEECAG